MTTTSAIGARPSARRRLMTLPATAVMAGLSIAVGAFALLTAPGITQVSDTSYDTTFVTGTWWLAYALVPVAVALAYRAGDRLRTYAAVGAALALPHFAVAAFVVYRYVVTGWSDGLEGFAFVHPVGLTLLTAIVMGIFGSIDRGSDARR